jgi:hypothetical protein
VSTLKGGGKRTKRPVVGVIDVDDPLFDALAKLTVEQHRALCRSLSAAPVATESEKPSEQSAIFSQAEWESIKKEHPTLTLEEAEQMARDLGGA